MKSIALSVVAACTALVVGPTAQAADTAVLTIKVSHLSSNKGQVGCVLFDAPGGFPTEPNAAAQRRWCTIASKLSSCRFDPIPAGVYAVACFHDENRNNKLDKFLGIPTEDTVASNGAKGFMGPPSFDKAKFSFPGTPTELELPMN